MLGSDMANYPCMFRRSLLQSLPAGALALSSSLSSKAAALKGLGLPGPYRGKVVSVEHAGSVVNGAYQAEPVQKMMRRGMQELTGADGWVDAWRRFAEPGDVVGIKLNPVGQPHVMSPPAVLPEIIAGLTAAGPKPQDIVAYPRYRLTFLRA